MKGKHKKKKAVPEPPQPTAEAPKPNPYIPVRPRGQRLEFAMPPHARPWPLELKPPSFNLGREPAQVPLDDGLYYRTDPFGGLQFMAVICGGWLSRWLVLDGQGGALYRSPWGAQRYLGNGLEEHFSRDDDTSPPYATRTSLSKWARGYLKSMAEERPPEPKTNPAQGSLPVADPGEEAPPNSERILSSQGEPPSDLEERLLKLGYMHWDDARECYRQLVGQCRWEPGLARDLCNFGPAACAWALSGENARLDQGFFLYPQWDRPGDPGVARLDGVALYRRVRELALASLELKDPFGWVANLARVNPVRLYEGTQSQPIVWTVPPPDLCGFWMTLASVDLLLRQEASRHIELASYLEGADHDRLLRAAALVGAFLQASRATGATYFQPDLLHSEWRSWAEDLADLIAELDDRPLLPGNSDPSNRRPHWIGGPRTPIVTALGSWVEGRRKGTLPRSGWQQLGRFINDRGDSLCARIQALQKGRLYFDARQPLGWQRPEFEGWGAPAQQQRFHQRALEAANRMDLAALLAGFDVERFTLRMEAACFALARAPREDLSRQHRPLVAELEPYLKEHKHLSPEQLAQLSVGLLGVPVRTVGRGYVRLLAAALWVLSGWDAQAWENPQAHLAPAVGLAHRMLSSL